MSFEIRKDLLDFQSQLSVLIEYHKEFKKYEKIWSDLKNNEDFYKIDKYKNEYRGSFENIYNEGRIMAYSVCDELLEFNEISLHKTLESFINESNLVKYWLNKIEYLEQISKLAKKSNKIAKLYSIKEMITQFDKQVNQLKEIKKVLNGIKENYCGLNYNNILDRINKLYKSSILFSFYTSCIRFSKVKHGIKKTDKYNNPWHKDTR